MRYKIVVDGLIEEVHVKVINCEVIEDSKGNIASRSRKDDDSKEQKDSTAPTSNKKDDQEEYFTSEELNYMFEGIPGLESYEPYSSLGESGKKGTNQIREFEEKTNTQFQKAEEKVEKLSRDVDEIKKTLQYVQKVVDRMK